MEEKNISDSLEEVIATELDTVKGITDPEVRSKHIKNNIVPLYQLKLDETKEEHNFEEKLKRLEMDKEHFDEGALDHRDDLYLRKEELEEKVKDRKWRYGKEIAVVIGGAVVNLVGFAMMFNFEQKGAFTSSLKSVLTNNIFKHKK